MHPLLVEQLGTVGLEPADLSEKMRRLLALVDAAYAAPPVHRHEGFVAQASDLRRIVEALPFAVIVRRGDRMVFVNTATVRVLAYESADELVGREVTAIVAPEYHAKVRERMARVDEGGHVEGEDRVFLAKDGSKRLMKLASAQKVTFDGHPSVLLAFEDITERRQMETRVQIADRMSSLGTLAAGVAHEINNPLSYVLANLDYAIEEVTAWESDAGARPASLAESLRALGDAASGARRVKGIVDALKTFSRIHDVDRRPIAINDVVKAALQVSRGEVFQRATVVTDLQSLPYVVANEGQMLQVFVNLLANAAHAFGEGRGVISVRSAVRGEGESMRVVVEVSDNGCGIAATVLPRIFEPFFTTKQHGHGTGLGLSVSHAIVTTLGGDIEVESELGSGTVFRVVLPVLTDATESSRPAPPRRSSKPVPRRARILIVDDEPPILKAMERVLNTHDVVSVPDGHAALALLDAGEPFDVILCDLMMPGLRGDAVYAAVRARWPALAGAFILTSGGTVTAQSRRFVREAKVPLITKPFTANELRSAVAAIVGKAKGEPDDQRSMR